MLAKPEFNNRIFTPAEVRAYAHEYREKFFARLPKDPEVILQNSRIDPWFFFHFVKTKDQADLLNPVKPYPVHKRYLKLVTRLLEQEQYLGFPKSRRMVMSWTVIAFFAHDIIFHHGRSNAVASRKEDAAHELVSRADFILSNLDERFPKALLPHFESFKGKILVPELGSEFHGYPQGANQLRQYGFSRLLLDEMAFMEQAKDLFGASVPTLDSPEAEQSGQVICLSSPAQGFFKQICFDQLDDTFQMAGRTA